MQRNQPREQHVALRSSGARVHSALQELLAAIADVEAGGWDVDHVRLPKHYALALMAAIGEESLDRAQLADTLGLVERFGAELALRRWLRGDQPPEALDAAAEAVLEQLAVYRAALQEATSRAAAT